MARFKRCQTSTNVACAGSTSRTKPSTPSRVVGRTLRQKALRQKAQSRKLMIDPYDLTKPWDNVRLQEWFLFGVCVAGKSARQTADKVEALLEDLRTQRMVPSGVFFIIMNLTPFECIEWAIRYGKLGYYLRK